MDSVAFLQQEIQEICRQLDQLDDKRRKLQTEYYAALKLQENNLQSKDDQV